MGLIARRPLDQNQAKQNEQDARISALEARLDALVSMLAEDAAGEEGEEGEPVTDLDGNKLYRDRDESDPL